MHSPVRFSETGRTDVRVLSALASQVFLISSAITRYSHSATLKDISADYARILQQRQENPSRRCTVLDARYSILDTPPKGFPLRSKMLDACACRFSTLGLGRKSSEENSEYVETAQLTCVTASMGKPILQRTEARNLPYLVPHRRYMNQSSCARYCSTGNLRSSFAIRSND